MGCGNCGVATEGGKPSGCQSNGGCSSGGCNRLNVFNWLSDIPLSDFGKPYDIVEISFNKGSRKDYYRNSSDLIFHKGEMVAVEGVGGFDVGEISLMGELVKLQLKKYGVKEEAVDKRILRTVTDQDLNVFYQQKDLEKETLIRARAIAKQVNLEMKIAEAEWQADGKKVTFFYTADSRVDFRELIKVYASEYKAKIEMRQIGARQESAKVGGIGSCGRELCCSTWLSDFKTVNTTAARYQNLSINQTKLSGQCGRLKCCLNFELDTYMDSLKGFPMHAESLELVQGKAYLQKKDIFKNLMWYSFGGSNKQYPLAIERVKTILAMNAKGETPEELEPVEIQVTQKGGNAVVEMGFVNDVGQIQLSSLKGDKSNNRKKKKPSNRPAGGATSQGDKPRNERTPQERPANAGGGKRPNQSGRPQQTQATAGPKKGNEAGVTPSVKAKEPNRNNKQHQARAPKPEQNENAANAAAPGTAAAPKKKYHKPKGERPPRPEGAAPPAPRPKKD